MGDAVHVLPINDLLAQAELAWHAQRTGSDAEYDPDLEAYLNGKCDGIKIALEVLLEDLNG